MTPPPTRDNGFFDPQVNGYAGVDFQRDGVDSPALLAAVRAWRRDGGGQFLLTLITDEWSRMLARLRSLRRARDENPEVREAIPGWHLEGPFLSEKPGFHGAHDPAFMRDPRPDDMAALREIVGDDTLLVTLAPERRGAVEAIAVARGLGIKVSLGHSDASATGLREAVAAGATGFTHLANGCTQQLDRHDNIVWRVIDTPGLMVGIIADGIHVSPALFRVLHRALPPERIYYTTDAMAAAGSAPGRFTIGRVEVEVGAEGVVRQPGRTNFAGSSLRPCDLIERSRSMLATGGTLSAPAGILGNAARWLGTGVDFT